jgi:hypothetical protein
MRHLFALCVFGAVTVAGRDAGADVATEARFFDDAGRRAYEAGRYEQALESFQLVQELSPSPRMLYNIALCADLAGRGDMAFSLYGEYLKSDDSDPKRRAEAQRRAEQLRSKLALVAATSDPDGAAIYVDRKELGQFGVTPATIAVSAGEHHLIFEQPGFRPAERVVSAKIGTLSEVAAPLTPLLGRLRVNVTPGSAELRFLRDGKPVSAPHEGAGYPLPVGSYRVVATAPGYASAEAAVVVREDATSQLDLGLVPLQRATGLLLVSTGRTIADVYLDGRRVAVTPATVGEVAVGSHALELRVGGRVVRRTVTIEQGKATHIGLELAPGR